MQFTDFQSKAVVPKQALEAYDSTKYVTEKKGKKQTHRSSLNSRILRGA